MENYSAEIVDNIKQEPEQHYFFEIPKTPEPTTSGTKTDESQQNSSSENVVQCKKSSSLKFKKNLVDKKTYECGYCDEKFDSYNSKKTHVARVHISGSSWKCFKCSYNTLGRGNLTQHYKSHSKKFSCETCLQNFRDGSALKHHQQQHQHGVYATRPVTYECDICAKTFNSKQIIRKHIEIHFKIQCPICPRMLARRWLNAHIEQHSSTTKFRCDVCNKLFRSQNDLTAHQKRVHEVENVQCDYCNKFLKNKTLLKLHLQIHVKAPCSVCRKPITKCQMKRHMKSIHSSGKLVLSCKIAKCHQKFSNVKDLDKHQQIHMGTCRYKCSKCEYEVKTLHHVLRHSKRKSH